MGGKRETCLEGPIISLTSFLVTYQPARGHDMGLRGLCRAPLPQMQTQYLKPHHGSHGFDPVTLLDFPVLSKHS